MPYITREEQVEIMKGKHPPFNCGQLNFKITKLILTYLPEKPNYANYNEVIGVLECIKQELYRRMIAPYEDKKMEENGDIFNIYY